MPWQDWALVDDLPPGPGEVYRVDPVTGEIRFGNYRRADRDGQRLGAAVREPDPGRSATATSTRALRATSPPARSACWHNPRPGSPATGITSVTNLGPGRDGADEEPIEETMRRAPEELKIRDRAVTVDDYEFLAREASTDVAIQRCLTPRLQTAVGPAQPPAWQAGDPWTFGGIDPRARQRQPDHRARPGLDGRHGPSPPRTRSGWCSAYLEPRRDLTAHLQVVGPRYLPVIVSVEPVVWQEALDAGADQDKVRGRHPGPDPHLPAPDPRRARRHGLAGRQPVFTSDLFRAIMPTEDLGYISTLQVQGRTPPPTTSRR